jgi:tRNA A37 threonylcarbamoyladenosine dehydratase
VVEEKVEVVEKKVEEVLPQESVQSSEAIVEEDNLSTEPTSQF